MNCSIWVFLDRDSKALFKHTLAGKLIFSTPKLNEKIKYVQIKSFSLDDKKEEGDGTYKNKDILKF